MTFSDEHWRQVMGSAAVQAAVRRRATTIAARARKLTQDAGGKAVITIEQGMRANGRPYVNVVSSNADEEYGTSDVRKRRALRRAAQGG